MTIKKIFILFVVAGLAACKADQYLTYKEGRNSIEGYPMLNDSTLLVQKISTNPRYGRIPEKPIFVGVVDNRESGENRIKFLNALEAEDGDTLVVKRLKACCPFRTLNSRTIGADQKFGLLDMWVILKRQDKNWSDTLYVNAYDDGELIAPKGYKIKSK